MEAKNFLKVGMSKEDITPQLGCLLYGYPRERRAVRVLDSLYVSAIALEQKDQTVLLMSADVCCIDVERCDEIRMAIEQATGVKKANILYATIHTHSGPVTHTSAGWGEADVEYIRKTLIPCSIKAAQQALSLMRPAVMGVGSVESMAGINRREIDSEGRVILGQNPQGPYDPTMTVITFRDLDGGNIGNIIHFAMHPTSAGSNDSITRDWPSYMVDRLEEVTGAPCMFLNGAEGDVGPRLSTGLTWGLEEGHAKEIGLIAAEDAVKAYSAIREYQEPELSVTHGDVLLTFVQPPSLENVEREIEALGDPDKLIDVENLQYAQLQKVKEIYLSGADFPKGLKLDQTVVALGNLAMVPVPFEPFCNIALSLQEQSPFATTFMVAMTGGDVGYIPTQDQIPYGGYEVDSFHSMGIVSLVDHADKELVTQSVELLKKLKKNMKGGC